MAVSLNVYGWIALLLAAGALFVMGRAYFQPLGFGLKAGIQVIAGGAALYAWDLMVPGTHWTIGVNPVTATLTGWLGGPGLALLLGMRWMGTHPMVPALMHHIHP